MPDKALTSQAQLHHAKLPLMRSTPRFGVPIAWVGKFIGIELHYSGHAVEAGIAIPKEPIVFILNPAIAHLNFL